MAPGVLNSPGALCDGYPGEVSALTRQRCDGPAVTLCKAPREPNTARDADIESPLEVRIPGNVSHKRPLCRVRLAELTAHGIVAFGPEEWRLAGPDIGRGKLTEARAVCLRVPGVLASTLVIQVLGRGAQRLRVVLIQRDLRVVQTVAGITPGQRACFSLRLVVEDPGQCTKRESGEGEDQENQHVGYVVGWALIPEKVVFR